MEILIGSDPEVFASVNGKKISAHDLIPGTKVKPHRVPKGAIQVDGVAMEFNTAPARTSDEFVQNIESVMTAMLNEARTKNPDVEISIEPTAYFDQDYFDALPEFPKMLGCTPDFDAYSGEENSPPETTEPFRTGAGHIHIGFTKGEDINSPEHFLLCRNLVKQMDAGLFPVSLLWDDDQKRRELYGKIGAFRPKHYGVEWRPISNAYLRRKFVQKYVFEATMQLSKLFFDGVLLYEDAYAIQTVNDLRENREISKTELRAYIRYLNENYGLPLFI